MVKFSPIRTRRRANPTTTRRSYPYYKLASWNEQSFTWVDGKTAFDSDSDAVAAAVRPGRYRVSTVHEAGRTDGAPFSV